MIKMIFLVMLVVNVALFGMIKGLWGPAASESHEPARAQAQIHPEQLTIVSNLQEDDSSGANEHPSAASDMPPVADAATPVTAENQNPPAEITAPVHVASDIPAPKVDTPVEKTTPVAAEPQPETVPAQTAAADTPQPAQPATPAVAAVQEPVLAPKNNNLMCLEAGYFVLGDARKFETQINRIPLGMKEVRRSVEEVVSYMVRIPANGGQAGANRRSAELQRIGIHDFYIVPGTYAVENLRWSVSLGVFRTENAAKAYMRELGAKGIKPIVMTPRKASSSKIAYQFKNVTPVQRSQIDKVMRSFSEQDLHPC